MVLRSTWSGPFYLCHSWAGLLLYSVSDIIFNIFIIVQFALVLICGGLLALIIILTCEEPIGENLLVDIISNTVKMVFTNPYCNHDD